MTQVLQVGNLTITPAELMPLLAEYRMLPQLWRELIIDSAVAAIELTASEQASALEKFAAKYQLQALAEQQAWVKHYGMSLEQLSAQAMREFKIEKFKQLTWEPRLEAHFLSHKLKLDKVIYSILRTSDHLAAQELYFRIKEGEQSFAELAREYSQGPEAQTGGMLGPVELSKPHPALAKLLATSQPGQLWPPIRLGEWMMIVRLEKYIPAQLDEPMRQQLLNGLFEAWLSEQFVETLHCNVSTVAD